MSDQDLQTACRAGDLKAVERLLAEGESPNNYEGSSPLALAMNGGHLAIAKTLIQSGALVDEFYEDGTTLLTTTVEQGRLTLVKLLVESGAQLVSPVSEEHALLVAARAKKRKIYDYLAQLVEPEVRDEGDSVLEIVSSRKATQRQQLVEAAAGGDLPRMRLLIFAGVDVNGFNELKTSPLMAAAQAGRAEAVDLLLDAGADPGRGRLRDFGPLNCAAAHPEIIRRLLDAGADPDQVFPVMDEPDSTPMCSCIVKDSLESFRLVRERAARTVGVDDREFGDWVWVAARQGSATVMRALLEEGWDVNRKAGAERALGHVMYRPLPDASERHVALIRCLLDAGADPDTRWGLNATPVIHLAFETKWETFPEVGELLLNAGADLDAPDGTGASILHLAGPRAWMAIVKNLPWRDDAIARMKRLVELGPNLQVRDREGRTVAERIEAAEARLSDPPDVKQQWRELPQIKALWRLLGR